MRMRRLAVAAASLGAASFLVLALTPHAVAAEGPLPVFNSVGTGQGLVASAAIRPSILESAGQGGLLFAETSVTSQGGGFTRSLAAPVFPGGFAVGAVTGATGCGGIKGWVEARYPPTDACNTSQEDSFARSNIEQLRGGVGEMAATADLGAGTSDLAGTSFTVRPSAGEPPLLRVAGMTVDIDTARVGHALEQLTLVSAQEIRLLDDAVVIGSMVSRALTRTDGVSSTAAASLTFGDVVVTIDGERHEATITNEGVVVNDPELSREANIGLSETIEEELARAGISISASHPVEITEGGRADASIGGLTFSFSTTLPSIPIPDEAAPAYGTIIENIPTKCVVEITHEDRPDELAPITDGLPRVPLCFGAGVIPLGGSEPIMTLTVGGASSFSVGARPAPIVFPDPPGGGFSPPGSFGPIDTGSPPDLGGITPEVPGDPAAPPAQQQPPPASLVGLVSNLPDAALAIAGAVFTILAFALAAWPSLAHAGPR